MSSINTLPIFTTSAHPCSYLDDREATTIFVDPDAKLARAQYTQLSQIGFRRSGAHYYQPHCANCQECIPTRVPVAQYQPTRSQKRIVNKNKDLQVEAIAAPICDKRFESQYELYEKYIAQRHTDGDMYPPSKEQFKNFLHDGDEFSQHVEFCHQEKLIAVSVVDVLDDGLSAIYTYFDPDEQQRSLGSYAILWMIDRARQLNLDFVYLGYWIKDCKKMSYKTKFRPLQLRIKGQWTQIY